MAGTTPLAKHLRSNGYKVVGTRTTAERLPEIHDAGIKAFPYRIGGPLPQEFIRDMQILVVATPHKAVEDYPALISQISASEITKVIYISSTSVYELSDTKINETGALNRKSSIVMIENEFRNNSGFSTTILRFGGLIGPDRHPGRFFKNGKLIPNPNGVINLIHQTDCIQIIQAVIERSEFHGVFNAVSPDHSTRRKYYTEAFKQFNTFPKFDESKGQKGKYIDGNKLENNLNYKFKYFDLIKNLSEK